MALERYLEAVGRRKTAVARVRLTPGAAVSFSVNGKELEKYFPLPELQRVAREALADAPSFSITARVRGGGIAAQAGAIRHAVSRALVAHNAELRPALKKSGFLRRDPRVKERRKFGLKKARKAPQWAKR